MVTAESKIPLFRHMLTAFLASASEAASGANPLTDIQRQFGIEASYVGMQLISFIILAAVLYRFGIRPILATMDDRQKKIEEGLRFSDEMRVKLAEAERSAEAVIGKASVEAAAILKKAREDADARIAAAARDAIAQAEIIRKNNEEALALEHRKMLDELRSEVARLVVDTSSKVLTRELSEFEKIRYAEAAAREVGAAG